MGSYEVVIGIEGELLFLGVPHALDEDHAIQQVYDSDQVAEYGDEATEHIEIIEVVREVEE